MMAQWAETCRRIFNIDYQYVLIDWINYYIEFLPLRYIFSFKIIASSQIRIFFSSYLTYISVKEHC